MWKKFDVIGAFVGDNRRKGHMKELTLQFFRIAERNQSSGPGNQNESKAEKSSHLGILKWTHRTSEKKREKINHPKRNANDE